MDSSSQVTERILCAAIHVDDGIERHALPLNLKTGVVAAGWRHHNCLPQLPLLLGEQAYAQARKDGRVIQGFLTSTGRFVDREEGANIAWLARQTSDLKDLLFSEHLY
jgi:hypothetical protein